MNKIAIFGKKGSIAKFDISSISLAYPQSGDSGIIATGGGDAGGGGESDVGCMSVSPYFVAILDPISDCTHWS